MAVQVDERNAEFWDEPCGSIMARQLGLADQSEASLAIFDDVFTKMYPHALRYLDQVATPDAKLLEIGLGYGTIGQILADRGVDYHGLDIAEGPVRLMLARLERVGVVDAADRVMQGSALDIPAADGTYDAVVAFGCLHHVGDLPGAVAEVHRVLRPDGKAVVSFYHSGHPSYIVAVANGLEPERIRGLYDANLDGDPAPHTDFVSIGEALELFSAFRRGDIAIENGGHELYVVAER